jgi:aminomethyltransferase
MNETNYRAALEQSAWRNLSHFGRFRLRGKDAATLLHHLTTNDIKRLKPETGCEAALISAKARVLDWLSIWRTGDGYIVLTSPNRRAMFAPHARKFILFRQDVQIEDVTESTHMYGLIGPQAQAVFGDKVLLPADNKIASAEPSLHVARSTRLPFEGWLMWSEQKDELTQFVNESGALLLDDETYNILRIEAGVPVAGLELTEDVNPWEAGLNELISLHKGCYNGQEIVARLNTYQKVKQKLLGLKLQTPLPMGTRADFKVEGRSAGFLTSSAHSPRFGPIGLGFVRTDWQTVGQEVQVVSPDREQTGIVSELPFTT